MNVRARLVSALKSVPMARATKRKAFATYSSYRETRDRWIRKLFGHFLDRWIYRKPTEVVKSNKKKAFDYFFSQDEFIQTDYLREDRLEFYDRVADYCVPQLVRSASEPAGFRLIDVGCGTGHFLLALRRRVGDAGELSGLDFSSAAIARARNVVPDATFTEADIYEIPFPDDSFDFVTSLETLEHLKTPRVALDEMVRICKPTGRMVITVPNADEDEWKGHVNFWTVDTLSEFLAPAGAVEVIKIPGALLACVGMASASVLPIGTESSTKWNRQRSE